MSDIIALVHPKHGRVTVSKEQWDEKKHVTGWDEATARKNGYVPESEPNGKEIAAKLDQEAAKKAKSDDQNPAN